MECLSVGRHSLRRARVVPFNLSHCPRPLSLTNRSHVFLPTPRRKGAHTQSKPVAQENQDNKGSSKIAKSEQAYPFSGYYSVILNTPSPYHGNAPVERSTEAQPETQPEPEDKPAPKTMAEAQTPQERMAIVFGTRLAGPGRESRYNPGEAPPVEQWKKINGIPIPPRPEEPENCCMSGCVNCVWDGFRDEMEEWAATIANAKAKGGSSPLTGAAPGSADSPPSLSMDDDGGGSETNWPAPKQGDDLFSDIPVGIREFMKTEKKLKVKHQKEAMA
ncbi:hypothetical protein N7509_003792 [Penicillium cosmopolitanum]|uniref:Oxidoreductase-like domain-containing protein n=1 Tax=Penicillium cosmopolitanum TaxID=1131564 RepID=A0A9W9W5S6_9EURO|nr:uncharacterized protein N7509_003792 [Penicillium cosmopolitanum]KAJ5403921.1 hypothetical protein N7509_003792 [Penicillium cosmopolitanum]